MRNTLFFGSLLLLLSSCVATQNVPVDIRSRTFSVSQQTLYEATLAYLVLAGYQIDEANPKSGIITTGYRKSGIRQPGDRTRLTALIQDSDRNRSRVILTLTVEVVDSSGVWTNAYFQESTARKLYQKHFRGIERQLAGGD